MNVKAHDENVVGPPVITLSIMVQYSEEQGEWVASSDTHPELSGRGVCSEDAFLDLCSGS